MEAELCAKLRLCQGGRDERGDCNTIFRQGFIFFLKAGEIFVFSVEISPEICYYMTWQ